MTVMGGGESNWEINDLFSLLFITTYVNLWLRPLLETLLIAIHRRRRSRRCVAGFSRRLISSLSLLNGASRGSGNNNNAAAPPIAAEDPDRRRSFLPTRWRNRLFHPAAAASLNLSALCRSVRVTERARQRGGRVHVVDRRKDSGTVGIGPPRRRRSGCRRSLISNCDFLHLFQTSRVRHQRLE